MKNTESFNLNNTRIASPCDVGFENMEGDERVRYCDSCSMNVYNIGSMSSDEAVKLIQEKEGRLCIQLYRRKDGTILTDNCPIGMRRLRDRLARTAVMVLILSSLGWLSAQQAESQGLVGAPIGGRFGQSNEVRIVARAAEKSGGGLLLGTLLFLKSGVWLAGKNNWRAQTWLFMAYFLPFACGTLVHFCYLGITDDIVITITDGLSRSFGTGVTFGLTCLFFAYLRLSGESKPLFR